MVVLEGAGGVVTIGNNQYLQPDYLSPLPSTMDTKKSPLALLAQTCSQIGADSNAVKPILNLEKKKNNDASSSGASKSPSQVKTPKASTPQASTEIKLTYKPYEANVLQHMTKPEDQSNHSQQQRPSSKSSSSSDANGRVPSRNKSNNSPEISVTKQSDDNHTNGGKSTPSGDHRKTVSPSGSSQRGASPIVRSGMEVLHGHPSAYKPGGGAYGPLNPLSAALCCPPGMEQHGNPAFRAPFTAGYTAHHHAAMLAAANGYPGAGQNNQNAYLTYQRIKTASGVETVVPVCKDPYCTGCPFSLHAQQMLMGAPCPSGCAQCEHQKYSFAIATSMGSLPPGHPYSVASASALQMRSAPYTCSWIMGDSYCGKRFNTSDELFSHLRTTHTGNLSDPAAAAAALAQSQAQSLISSLFPPSAMQRGYPTAPLSPMSAAAANAAAARYHPYMKPGSLPLNGSPFANAAGFNHAAAAAALGPYYSPYAMYGQRNAVHQ